MKSWAGEMVVDSPLHVGVSSCLLGQRTRYDGRHKLDTVVSQTLGRFIQYVPVCPEVECGLPTRRPPMQLVGDRVSPRIVTMSGGIDHTDRLLDWAALRLKEIEEENLDGFIFKSLSPSCGIAQIPVGDSGRVSTGHKAGAGIFAGLFMARFPLIPVEEDRRLADPDLRENFIQRIFIMRRWRQLLAGDRERSDLAEFNRCHEMQLFAHSSNHLRLMRELVNEATVSQIEALYTRYQRLLLGAVRRKATIDGHTQVLLRIVRRLQMALMPDEKQEFQDIVADYANGTLPLIVPITLLRQSAARAGVDYLERQTYLHPDALELRMRNHA